jgi:GNAT superfamily N-acetyltransferase
VAPYGTKRRAKSAACRPVYVDTAETACGVGCTVVDVPVRGGEPSDAAFIVKMAQLASVMPSDRGRGVGRCLLDALTARAAEHGYDRLALNVHIRNPAVRLYSRVGFVVAGKGRGPLGVAMVLQLPRDPPRIDKIFR